jgi:drug/metabolite transporter (DMT)-like permease
VLVVQYSWPFLIVLFSLFIPKERLTIPKGAAVLLGFSGVLLVLTKGDLAQVQIDNLPVVGLVGVGAACFALFSVLRKRVTQEPIGVVAVYFGVATIAALLSMLLFSDFALPAANELFAVLLNGVLVNGFFLRLLDPRPARRRSLLPGAVHFYHPGFVCGILAALV